MSIRHLIVAGALGAGLLAGVAPSSAAERASAALATAQSQSFPGEAYSQYYRRGGYYGRGYRRGYGGGGIAAGVIGGLAAGALIGGLAAQAQPAPVYGYGGPGQPVGNVYGRDPSLVDYCARRYRSYDPASGTFLANDGNRYLCE